MKKVALFFAANIFACTGLASFSGDLSIPENVHSQLKLREKTYRCDLCLFQMPQENFLEGVIIPMTSSFEAHIFPYKNITFIFKKEKKRYKIYAFSRESDMIEPLIFSKNDNKNTFYLNSEYKITLNVSEPKGS